MSKIDIDMHSFLATLLIVWHSRTTASQQLALSAAKAAKDVLKEMDCAQQVQVLCKRAQDVDHALILEADAYLFCAPENLGSLTGEMKAFFDKNYYAVIDQINGRPYGLMISAGSDGHGAAKQTERICTGWRLELISPAIIVNVAAQTAEDILATKNLTPEQTKPAQELGGLLAAHLALAIE